MSKMKIVYISSSPAGMRSQSIYFDLMQSFVEKGHEVYCVFAEEKRNEQNTHTFFENGIQYLGVRTGNLSKNPNLFSKAMATLMIDGQFRNAIAHYFKDVAFDLVLYSTPPITFVKTIEYFKEKDIKVYLMLKDIFPQNAVDLQMFRKGGLIHRFFKRKEKRVYDLSDYIGVMSEANKEFLLNQEPQLKDKVDILPNAIKINENVQKQLDRSALGLPEDDVLFLYGGNIGKPQSPEFIIQCIQEMEQVAGAKFIICGWGAKTQMIIDYIEAHNIKNTQYLGSKDVETFNQITKACDVGLIFLDYRFTIPNFPQRLLSYLDASLPVICATDEACDMGSIAKANGFGYYVPSIDSEAWKAHVVKLTQDKQLREEMGYKGHQYLKAHYDVQLAYAQIVKQIKEDAHV